jgi:hypothetical protein
MILTMERIREPAGRKPPRRPAKGRAGPAVPLSFGRGLMGLGLVALVVALFLVP